MAKDPPPGKGLVPHWFLSERTPVLAASARVEIGMGFRLTVPVWLADGLDWLDPGKVHGMLGAKGCISLLPPSTLEEAVAEYDVAIQAQDWQRALGLGIRHFAVAMEGLRRPRLPEPAQLHLGATEKHHVYVARAADALEIWSEDYYREVVERLAQGGGLV